MVNFFIITKDIFIIVIKRINVLNYIINYIILSSFSLLIVNLLFGLGLISD